MAFSAWVKYSSCKVRFSASASRFAFRAARPSGSMVITSFARLMSPSSICRTCSITLWQEHFEDVPALSYTCSINLMNACA
ncbi:MAG: hypothetical protein ACLRL5_10965 [Acutalibacteraceae bacterium]